MVLGALGKLSGDAIRGLARNLFPGFYERGLTANQALSELRASGLGYKRQDFLNDFRIGESRYDFETRIKFTNLDANVTERSLFPEYHGVPDKYSFVFRAEGVDPLTGEERQQYFYYHTDSLLTRRELEDKAKEWASNLDTPSGGVFDTVSVREGYINPVWA